MLTKPCIMCKKNRSDGIVIIDSILSDNDYRKFYLCKGCRDRVKHLIVKEIIKNEK